MFKKAMILGAILAGLAVSAPAQVKAQLGARLSLGKGLTITFGKHQSSKGRQAARPEFRRVVRPTLNGQRHRSLRLGRGHDLGPSHRCYQTVQVRVWVPGCSRQVYVPARYEYHYDYLGRRIRVCVEPAHYVTVQDPGHFEYRQRQVPVDCRCYS